MKKKTNITDFKINFKQLVWTLPLSITMAIGWSNSVALGTDPFRSENPREIGKYTEEAFKTVMQHLTNQGNEVIPPISAGWQEEDKTPDGIHGSSTNRYWHEEWTKTIQNQVE